MPSLFKPPRQIVDEMLVDLEAMTGMRLQATDFGREEVLKMWVHAGPISGFFSQLQKVFDDFFPGSAAIEALRKHLAARQLPDQIQPQSSDGIVRLTGVVGTIVPGGRQIKRNLDGAIFVAAAGGTVPASGNLDLSFESLATGQATNIGAASEAFTLITPVAGITAACTSLTTFRNGRDLETAAEMLARIEEHDRSVDTGGNLRAYERLASEASDEVVSATALKNPRGPGTVNTVITAGTTDIEAAVRTGQAVSRLPSVGLLAIVQAYIIDRNPTTDDHLAVAPVETAFAATVKFSLYDETLRTQVTEEITKIVKIFLYEAKAGETIHPTTLERNIDQKVGHLISARRVSDFSGGGVPSYTVPGAQILTPGVLTITSF
jgi:uncharacterized phage protein gp47/JayE